MSSFHRRLPLRTVRSLRGALWVVALAILTPSFTQAQPPVPVVVGKVVQQEVKTAQMYSATVMPSKRAIVGSAVDGRVVEFPIHEGVRVGDGATLAQLLTDTIKLEIEAARAELTLRSELLKELKNGARPEELAEALARMEAAKSAQDYSEAQYQRVLKAYKQSGAATKEELDATQSAMQSARETYKQYTAAYDLVKEGPRAEKIAQAQAQVDIQDAVVRRLEDQEKKHTIISRFAGYIVAEHTEVGQWVNRGDPVAEVVALDEVFVTASVLEAHIPYVKQGAEVRVEVAAVPDRVFVGKVAFVVPQGDLRARTFPVKVSVQNEIGDDGPLLKSGMIARVALATGSQQDALLAPKDAIVLGGPAPLVFVVDQDPKKPEQLIVRPVPLELGVASEGLIEVKGELHEGDYVVVRGNERLRPGQVVELIQDAEVESPERPKSVAAPGGASSP